MSDNEKAREYLLGVLMTRQQTTQPSSSSVTATPVTVPGDPCALALKQQTGPNPASSNNFSSEKATMEKLLKQLLASSGPSTTSSSVGRSTGVDPLATPDLTNKSSSEMRGIDSPSPSIKDSSNMEDRIYSKNMLLGLKARAGSSPPPELATLKTSAAGS